MTAHAAVRVVLGIAFLVLAAAVNRPLPSLGLAAAGLTLIAAALDRRTPRGDVEHSYAGQDEG